jgi:hypothetical protein
MASLGIVIGTGSVLVAVSFCGLLVLALAYGNTFRSAAVRQSAAPMLAMIGVGGIAALVLATTLWPHSRGLMHTVAVVLGLLAACLVLCLGPAPVMSSVGLAGVGLWFFYYWLAVWRTASSLATGSGLSVPTL